MLYSHYSDRVWPLIGVFSVLKSDGKTFFRFLVSMQNFVQINATAIPSDIAIKLNFKLASTAVLGFIKSYVKAKPF